MKPNDQFSKGPVSEQMARVSALFETQLHRHAPGEAPFLNNSRSVIEAPCELAPAVRRRFAKCLPESDERNR